MKCLSRLATLMVLVPGVFAQNLTWDATVDGNWDTATSNWTGDATVYTDGANVTFPASKDNSTITIQAGGVAPGSMLVTGNNDRYTFQGGILTGGALTVNTFATNDEVFFLNYGTSFTHASTLVNKGELSFRPNVLGTYSFGSGDITLDGGAFGLNGMISGDFFLTNNIIVTSNGGRILTGRGSGNPQHHYTGAFTLGGDLVLGDSAGGGPSNGDYIDIQGTMTLSGGDRTLTFGQSGNGGITLSGDIVEDVAGRQLTLVQNTLGGDAGSPRNTTIAGSNNTYSGGTILDPGSTSFSFIVDAASSLGTGDVTLLDDSSNLDIDLVLNGYNNISSSAVLSLALNSTINLNFSNTSFGVQDGDDMVLSGLVLNGVSQSPGIYNSTNTSGYFTGTGEIVVIPEPGTLMLVGIFGAALLALRRRRR